MKYSRVFIEAIGYELPPVVVTSDELEGRLKGVYDALRIPRGQLESLTGIVERRWWDPGYPLSEGAVQAAKHALCGSSVRPSDVDVLIYAGRLPRAVRAGDGVPGRVQGRRQHRRGDL